MTYTREQNEEIRKAQAKATKIAQAAETEGDDFLTAFDSAMAGMGFGYTGDHCLCAEDPDIGGHEPACGWSRIEVPA